MRRLRGILISMVLWAVPWALVGLGLGIALSRMGDVTAHPDSGRLGIPGLLALMGAMIGAANGLVFALFVVLAERKRTLETLRVGRVGLWGALASGGVATLVLPVPVVVLTCAALGFGAAGAMARLARRSAHAERRVLPPET